MSEPAEKASSPSRAAQQLAESVELDQRIGEETDELRAQIAQKNDEIAHKTKDLNKLLSQNQKLQEKLDLITDPTTQYSLVIDQGGGSFSAYLFALKDNGSEGDEKGNGKGKRTAVQLEKYKSVKLRKELTDPKLNAAVAEQIGMPMHAEDGTLNDYSFVDPKLYPLITRWFAAFYNNLLQKIVQSYGEVTSRQIRQTGKIRAVLMRGENEAQRKVWYDAFNAALGADWDYRLLSNDEEARIEGLAFYHFNDNLFNSYVKGMTPRNYVGVGIGSSSTQAYAQVDGNKIVVGYDSVAGAKANKAENEAGAAGNWRPPQSFTDVFAAIMKPVITTTPAKKVVVATNAIGFLCAEVTHPSKYPDWPAKAAFRDAVVKGIPYPAKEFQAQMQTLADNTDPGWARNFLLGFSKAICSFEQAELVLLEQKLHHGKGGLPVETSWVMYLAETGGSV